LEGTDLLKYGFLVLKALLFWFAMMLICCVMISFRFAMSDATSSTFVSLLSRLGATVALADSSFCVDLGAINCVLNDCWASRTFTLGFLVRPFGGAAGCAGEGDVVGTRLRVKAAIGAPGPHQPPCSGN
jgi:hypothetical protein